MTATGEDGMTISQALERSAAVGDCGFFFDFDGVLAPMRVDPESVVPTPGVVGQLASLESLAEKVAIISARPVQFLLRRFGELPGVSLYGLYGLESAIDGEVTTDPTARSWMPVVRAAIEDAHRQLPPGVYVEDKRLSVALHYRQHPEHELEVRQWAGAEAARRGLAEQRGRMVTELKPPVRVDKGTVLRTEVSDLRSAWYFGDDISDAKGFEALRDRRREAADFLAVCVAVRNPETGQALEDAADYTVAGPAAMPDLLASAVAIFADGKT
jgi:trehalose 6-phosphate phosphatase